MSLDISAYSRLESLAGVPEDELEGRLIHARAYPSFARSTRGLRDHDVAGGEIGEWIADSWYRTTPWTREYHFSAGSYGGYGEFRRTLAAMFKRDPAAYWNAEGDQPSLVDEPFYELINFADNEGCIGPEAAADLHADFLHWREAWIVFIETTMGFPDADYYQKKYDDWTLAFELAADGGLVDFH